MCIVYGYLDAQGTSGSEIYFTSQDDESVGVHIAESDYNANKGNWNGIFLNGQDAAEGTGYLNYCVFRYGGGGSSGVYYEPANLSNDGGYGYVKNCVFEYSAKYGYYHRPFSITIESNIFRENDDAGLCYETNSDALTTSIINNTFTNNDNYGVLIYGNSLPLTLSGNSGSGNTYDGISVDGVVITDAEWSSGNDFPVYLTNNIDVNSGYTLTFSSGVFNCGTYAIKNSGSFTLGSGAHLILGDENGISSSTSAGNIRVSGTRTFSPTSNYTLNGTTEQCAGTGFPTTVYNLTIDNNSGIILSNSTTVTGALDMDGNITTGLNTLILGSGTSNLGTLSRTSGIIIGNFQRWFDASTIANVLFPVGTTTNYRPVNLGFTSAPSSGGTITAAFTESDPGGSGLPLDDNGTSIVNYSPEGYWTLTAGDGFSGGTYDIDITADGFPGISDYTELYLLKRADSGSDWAAEGTHSICTGSNSCPTVHRTGLTSFSEFGIASTSENALPVELISFTASVYGENVILNWRTGTEVNNYGFEIQRTSIHPPPYQGDAVGGRGWETIGFINGSGNSNSPKSYSYTDIPTGGTTFKYRLKQIDFDGAYEYSDEVEVTLDAITEYSLEQNYPNPFNPTTTITYQIPETGNVTLKIYDVLGREVTTLVNESQASGVYTVEFNASQLADGVYIYKLQAGDYVSVKKLMLLK
ncbi:MAG: T9SS type A sorting domain-containing protein [Ignavibacteria bacterium]|jgi:hypothetical protein